MLQDVKEEPSQGQMEEVRLHLGFNNYISREESLPLGKTAHHKFTDMQHHPTALVSHESQRICDSLSFPVPSVSNEAPSDG